MNDSNPTNRQCPRCGSTLGTDAPQGLCPRCLAALPLGADTVLDENETKAAPLSPDELAPHFPQLEILECLGRGGMGVVYKARQKSLNRFIALKLLAPERANDPSFANRFAKEAQALAALNHPHIVGVYDFGQAGGFYFLLMEFVDGVNLRQAMKAGRFTPEQALAVVPPVCEALQFAHEHGIVHRDIKPENLLLDKDGRVKIADFGIAKMLGGDATGASPDQTPAESPVNEGTLASAAGTPQYMAPEQKAHRATDHRADIYSLGVVLYELLTGELPGAKLQPPSRKVQIDVRLDEIVLRALETKPELRYQTAGEMRTQVETFTSSPRSSRGHEAPSEGKDQSLLKSAATGPRFLKAGTSTLTTQDQLATFAGQFFCYRTRGQLILDERQITHSHAGTNTIIPLAAIRDLSIGRYPRTMAPAGIDVLSVTFEEGGQRKQVLLSPMEGWFGFPSTFNAHVAEWFRAIRAAAAVASGTAPTHTPADQLGIPRGSAWPLLAICGVPLLSSAVLIALLVARSNDGSGTFAGNAFLLICALLPVLAVWSFTGWLRPVPAGGSAAGHSWGERWKRWLSGALLVIAMVIPLKLWVVDSHIIATGALAPELPQGSRVLTWKLVRDFAPGDLIVYHHENRPNVGRVTGSEPGAVLVNRNGAADFRVPRQNISGKVISVLWRGSAPSGVTQFDIAPVGVSNNVVIVDVTTEVGRGNAELRAVLDGPELPAANEAALQSAFVPPFTGTFVKPMQDWAKQPSRTLSPGRQTWRLGFVLPDAALAKEAFEDIRPIGALPAMADRTVAGTLFEVRDANGQEFHASLHVALPVTPADPNWVSVSSAMSTPDASTMSSYNESGGVIMNWEVLASQPGPVFLHREGGQSTASLRRDPKTKLYQAGVSVELTKVGTDRVLLVTSIGGIMAREELPGNFRDLAAELWTYKDQSATTVRGTEIELCRFQGKPITVQVPVLTTTTASAPVKVPSEAARPSSAEFPKPVDPAPPDALFSAEQPVVVGGDMMVRVRLLMADKDGKRQPLDEEIIFKTAKDRATGFVLRWHAYGDKHPQHGNDVIVQIVDPDTGVILHVMEGGFGSGLRLTSPDNLPLPAKNKSHLLARPGVHTSFHLIRAETPAAPGAPITDWRDLHAEVTLINPANERPVPAFQMPTLAPKTAPPAKAR